MRGGVGREGGERNEDGGKAALSDGVEAEGRTGSASETSLRQTEM